MKMEVGALLQLLRSCTCCAIKATSPQLEQEAKTSLAARPRGKDVAARRRHAHNNTRAHELVFAGETTACAHEHSMQCQQEHCLPCREEHCMPLALYASCTACLLHCMDACLPRREQHLPHMRLLARVLGILERWLRDRQEHGWRVTHSGCGAVCLT
jgi:hypothetical protein